MRQIQTRLARFSISIGASGRRRQLTAWMMAIALAIGFGALYLAYRSASLDDFDSVSFALALREFDVARQQPQPPGFPLYVALGRLLLAVHPDPRWVLTTLSALSGAVAVGAIFGLGFTWSGGRRRSGVGAALLLGLMPVFWLHSEKALSDVPALAATLLAVFGLSVARSTPVSLVLAGGLAGLSLGFRPQNVVALVPFGLSVLFGLSRDGAWRTAGLALGGGVLGITLWLVPLAAATGGWAALLALVRQQGQHVWQADSIFAAGPLTQAALRVRLQQFWETFAADVIGIGLSEPTPTTLFGASVGFLALLVLLIRVNWRRPASRLAAAWLVLALSQNLVFESLERPRLMLLFLPALLLLVALALGRLPTPAVCLVLAPASLFLFLHTWPLASTLSTQPSPPAQAATYVRAHFAPPDALIATAGSFRHVQYEMADFKVHYLFHLNAEALRADVESGRYPHVVVFDRDAFQEVQAIFSEGKEYLPTSDLTFERDPRVHREHSRTRLVVLTRSDRLTPTDLGLPPGGVLQLGQPGDERYLGSGWYWREEVAGTTARWAGGAAEATVQVHLPAVDYQVAFSAVGYPPDQEVTVVLNGAPLLTIPLAPSWRDYQFLLPGDRLSSLMTVIELRHRHRVSAYEMTQGGSSDRRSLAAAYSRFVFTPSP